MKKNKKRLFWFNVRIMRETIALPLMVGYQKHIPTLIGYSSVEVVIFVFIIKFIWRNKNGK